MSNVIKLPRSPGNIRIEHSFGDVHLATPDECALTGDREGESDDCRTGGAYVPLLDEYQRGVEAGRTQAEAEFKATRDRLVADERARVEMLMSGIEREFLQLHARWEQRVLRFGLAVARAIVKHEVSIDQEVVIPQVRESLRHLVGVEKVKLRVNPRDEEIVRQHRTAIFSTADSLREMVIEPDEKIEPGGCIVESDSGNVDARLSAQIGQLEAMILDQSQQENRP